VVLEEKNRTRLSLGFYAVWLRVDAEEAWRRLEGAKDRPLLQVADPLKALQRLQREREPFYADVARLVLDWGPDTDGDELVAAVAAALRDLR
jgi:shikimate kinase